VFLDEAGSNIAMTREFARAPHGERAHDKVPRNRGTVTTMLGAITLEGVTAMMTIEGATCAEVFAVFVEQVLVPTLEPGDFVVLDNLGAHKTRRALDAIRNAGAIPVFLPPYSPELNPIELAWAKLKRLLKEAKARTRETLDDAIAWALPYITTDDVLGWFKHCGVRSRFN
jgi:transposase